jgi:hypothetical protein
MVTRWLIYAGLGLYNPTIYQGKAFVRRGRYRISMHIVLRQSVVLAKVASYLVVLILSMVPDEYGRATEEQH